MATTLPSFHPVPGLTTAPEETEAQQDPGPAAGGWQPRLPEAYSRFSECVPIRPCHRREAYASLLAHLCGDSGDRKSERGRTPLWPGATPSLPRPLPHLCRGSGRALLPPPPPRPLAQDRGGHGVPESPRDRGRRAEAGSLPSRAAAIARLPVRRGYGLGGARFLEFTATPRPGAPEGRCVFAGAQPFLTSGPGAGRGLPALLPRRF